MAAAAVTTDAGQTGGKRPEPPSLERLAAAFPQLEVIQFIGQGGMGAVYKARQKQLDRIVALKVLPPGIGGDPAFAERFTREAKALAKLLHPNIVALFEFGQTAGIYYLLMEFVDGVSLGQLLRSSRVSPREALAIVPQICDALQYAHDQGIVHRDIKPENILLDRRGRVKVADFGLAKLVEANAPLTPSLSPSDGERVAARPGEGENSFITDAGKIMGTPNYMAPEQVEHPAEVDHRADIYALGVVFYQMLTGELPGKSLEPPSRKVLIDVRLDEVVMRALEKNPELRYQQVSVLKTQVETIASGTAAPAALSGSRPTEAAQPVSSRPASRPWALFVVAALFIASGCSTAWEIGHDLPRHIYNFNFGVLALPIGIGLLRRRPWWRIAALASLWVCFAVILVAAGLAPTGRMLPYATVKWQGREVTGPLRIWIGLLCCTLGLALLVWMYRVLIRPDVKALFQRGPFARPWIEWGTLLTALVLALTVSWLLLETGPWWSKHEPAGVWIPARLGDPIGEQHGDAVIRVTDVSQSGQVALLELTSETSRADRSLRVEYSWPVFTERDHRVLARYSGPVFAYPANLVTTVTNIDCLLTPNNFPNDGHTAVIAGSSELKGKTAYQVGFVLPDEATATKVVEQVKQVHLGKLYGLSDATSALLLFSLHRRVDATGRPVAIENLTAELTCQSKSRSAENLESISGFGPVTERILPGDASLDLDSGRVVKSLPTELAKNFPIKSGGFLANQAAALNYMRQEGLDLFYSAESGLYADMKMPTIVGGNWDELNAEKCLEMIQRLEPGAPLGAYLEGQDSFGFKTREGGMGLLQITGFTENPRGVKLRYKLVPPLRDEGK
jgi:serine/threonine protein kinase